MRFMEFGDKKNPTIVLIAGGLISWKMYMPQIEVFCKEYYVVAPVLEGHDEERDSDFISIEKSAGDIANYINKEFQGKVFALCGASLGAVIAIHILSKQWVMTEKAIIESASIFPMNKIVKTVWTPIFRIAVKMAAAGKNVLKFAPKTMFEDLSKTCARMSEQSIKNIGSDICTYVLPASFIDTKVKIVYWHGTKEAFLLKKTIKYLSQTGIKIEAFKGYQHGELCIGNPELHIRKSLEFLKSN